MIDGNLERHLIFGFCARYKSHFVCYAITSHMEDSQKGFSEEEEYSGDQVTLDQGRWGVGTLLRQARSTRTCTCII